MDESYQELLDAIIPPNEEDDDEEIVDEFTCAYCSLRRYHLPGQHDQCDHSPTGECSESDVTNEIEETPAGANFKKWDKNITAEERFAVMNYSSGAIEYFPNDELRSEKQVPAVKMRLVKNLDNIIDRHPLPAPLTVYRGMFLSDEMFNEIQKRGAFADRGFVSTSRASTIANDFVMSSETIGWAGTKGGKPILMKIKLPQGFKAAPIERMVASGFEDQKEVLLPRNTTFIIKKVTQKSGLEILGGRKSDFILVEVDVRRKS